jgi:hypothetical protein
MDRKNVSVRGLNIDTFTSVKNICKNQGTTFKDFARPLILDLINETDDKFKKPCPSKEKKTIRLSEVISQAKYKELENICENIGVSISAYIKIKMSENLLKYSDYLTNIIE